MALLLLSVTLAACEAGPSAPTADPTPQAPTTPQVPAPTVLEVTLTAGRTTLTAGETLPLVAAMRGTGAFDQTLRWTTSAEAVAAVDSQGRVTARSAGSATITATSVADPGKSARVTLTVTAAPPPAAPPPAAPAPAPTVTGVTVTPGSETLSVGGTLQLTATLSGTGAFDPSVKWTTSNGAVATVDAQGRLTARSAGSATITATSVADPSRSASATVTVKSTPAPAPTITGVTVTPSRAALTVGGTLTLTATVSGTGAFDQTVRWQTSNAAVATIDGGGVVRAVAAGTATLTAISSADPTRTAGVTLTVTAPPAPPTTPPTPGVFIPAVGAPVGSGDGSVTGTVYVTPSAQEIRMLELINEARTQGTVNGADVIRGSCVDGTFRPGTLKPLTYNGVSSHAARMHSVYMSVVRYEGHDETDRAAPSFYGATPGDRIARSYATYGKGVGYSGWGENVAAGYRTPEEVTVAWMKSSGHCQNMMRAGWTTMATGHHTSAPDAAAGRLGDSWTQIFN
ncbi:hypothetical protein DEIPH_ctg066orf0013 [Deinococcus phoenicis]|uniref:BIG2 domain-containing protein n=1 Tax=Deinococcus phoenicis TaxID=1476583 RepID=A0A016QLF7_9DEIO|nr:hypothetical protein DEIPH_ctg066orf0013 [Deinococcus phoenicis]